MPKPNHLLRNARLLLPSRMAPGDSASPSELADKVNAWLWESTGERYTMTGHYLSKIERGEVRRPNPAYRSALRHVLKVHSDHDLGFDQTRRLREGASGSVEASTLSYGWDALEIARQFADLSGDNLNGLSVWNVPPRRTLTGVDLYSELKPFLSPVSGATGQGGKPITTYELQATERITADLWSWHTHPGAKSSTVVVAQLRDLSRRLCDAPWGSPKTQQAFRIAAQLATIIASMNWDNANHIVAQRFFILATQFAHAAGEDSLAASALTSLARQCFDLNRPNDGLEVVQLAQYATRRCATPRLRALLATREGWAYAQRGEAREFHRVVGLSEDHHAEGLQDEDVGMPAVASLDEAELYGVNGARYRDLALVEPKYARIAQSYIGRALKLRHPSRVQERVFDLIGLGRAHLVSREPERAAELVSEAIHLVERYPNGRVQIKLTDFCREAKSFNELPTVREVRDAITEVVVA